MQVTQQVYVAKEWVRNARKEVKVEANSHLETKKALEALKQEQAGLSKKLKEAIQAHQSAEEDLKTTER